MSWSLRLGSIAGIKLYVHFTFFLLIGWVTFAQFLRTGNWRDALDGLVYFSALAAIIVLHELGHALAARRYGIKTRDITLLPIGGLARLERMPDKPAQELVVALAGPAVNVVLAGVLYVLLAASGRLATIEELLRWEASMLNRLMLANVFLAIFNMLPAFPMDGGRVLRALLAMAMDYVQATNVAAVIGQGMAILFVVLGLISGNLFVILIALFVWTGAEQEAGMVRAKSMLTGIPVSRVMATQFQRISSADSLSDAASMTLSGFQHDFPVVDNGRVVGMLTRSTLLDALARSQLNSSVSEVMHVDFQPLHPRDSVETAMQRLRECECPALPVLDQGALVGVFTPEQVGEFLILRETLQGRKPDRRIHHDPGVDDVPAEAAR